MTYIQDKLDEIEEKTKHLDGLVDKPLVMVLVKEALTDYHNHIVENVKQPSDIRKARFESDGENTFDYGYDTKTKEILSLLQDTNPKEV